MANDFNDQTDISVTKATKPNNETDLLKAELLRSFENYLNDQSNFCVDNINLLEMLPKLLKLQNDKGNLYGRSYAKHGDLSIFFNLERKWDRIANIMDKAMKNGVDSLHTEASETPTETFMDTVVDLGLYALMWAGYIREKHPEAFKKFVHSNKL